MTTVRLADRQLPAHDVHAADDQARAPVPRIVIALTTTENSDCCHVMRDPRVHRRRRRPSRSAAARDGSRAKLLTSRIAENVSYSRSMQLRLELLDALLAVDQRRRVVAEAQIQERHDGQRQQRDRHVELAAGSRTSRPASMTDVASGNTPLITRFSIAYASTSTR